MRLAIQAISDLAALVAAGALAYGLWALPMRGQPPGMYLELAPLLGLFVLGYAAAGLYPGFGLGPAETLRRLSYVTTFGFLVVAAFSFALRLPHLYSRVTFAFALAFSLVLVPLARAALRAVVGRAAFWSEPIAIVGTGARAAAAARAIGAAPGDGYRVAAVLATGAVPSAEEEALPATGTLADAARLAGEGAHVALFDCNEQTVRLLDQLQQTFRHVIVLREDGPLPVEGIQPRNVGGVVALEYTTNLLRPSNQAFKRVLDVIGASLGLVIAAPVIAGIALVVKLIDRGPAFFTQSRAGLGNRRIGVPKIRTMRMDAEARLDEHFTSHPDAKAEWEAQFKLRDDPRLLPGIGRALRRFSLDELPQLLSVIRGDMSLVGPRPFPDYHLKLFTPEFLALRARVRPGITGLWQITVRSDGGIAEQQAYDSYYIRNWSVWLDLYLLARTIGAVASGRGAY